MTNKERLELNNQKIDAIIKSLEDKVIAITETGLEIELPEAFATMAMIYYFKVDDDTLLISGDTVTNIGIWIYHISTKEFSQIYNKNYKYNRYQLIKDKILIGGETTSYILQYDITKNEIKELNETWYYPIFLPFKDKVLINSTQWTYTGMSVYDYNTETIEKIYNSSYGFNTIKIYNENYALIGGGTGLLLYKYLDNSIKQVYSEGHSFEVFHKMRDKYLICSDATNSDGVIMFNTLTEEAIKVSSVGRQGKHFHDIKDRCIITCEGSSYHIIVYDYNTDIAESKYTGNRFNTFATVAENYVLMSFSTAGSTYPPVYYDYTSNSVIKATSSGMPSMKMQVINDRVLCGFNSTSQNLYIFDPSKIEEGTQFKSIYSGGYQLNIFKVIKNKCLIVSTLYDTTSNGIFLYNYDTNSVKKIYNAGKFDTFIEDGDNCYITYSDKANKRTVYYNYEDDSVKLVSYYLAEVK